MSKKNSAPNFFAPATAALLGCVLLLGGATASARQRATRSAVVNPRTAAVREATAEVLRETSEIRKLPVRRRVRSGAQSRAEIEQMLIRNLDGSSKPAKSLRPPS